jgi:hypothetical protein
MPSWKRVRDTKTGHEYDVDARSALPDGVEPVEDAPILSGPGARPRQAEPKRTADEDAPTTPAADDKALTPPRGKRGSQTRDTTPIPVPDIPADSKE